MFRYLLRTLPIHFARQRALMLLTMAGVALGVAAVFSVHLLNRSAVRAFGAAVSAVAGESDLAVAAAGPALPDRVYPAVLAVKGVRDARPVVRGRIRVHPPLGSPFSADLFGVDLLRSGSESFGGDSAPDPARALAPDFLALTRERLEKAGLAVGDPVEITCGTRRFGVRVAAALDLGSRHPLASDRTAVMDIARAQEILGRIGSLDRIEIDLREDADADSVRRRLQEALGPQAIVETEDDRAARAAGLLDAFRLNLTALSVVCLLVGLFLVRASVEASLLRRRGEFGLLRSLGASRAQVSRLVLAEVAWLAAPGIALGLWLGYGAAEKNLGAVSATVENLYLLEAVERLDAPPHLFAIAALAGLLGALLGALGPAWRIARDPPRELLSESAHHEMLGRAATRRAIAGAAAIAGAFGAYLAFGRAWRPAGFALGAAVLLALPLLAPALIRAASRRARPRGFGLALAWRSLGERLRTSSSASAALALAVSMLFAISLLLSSFRETVRAWIDATLRADIYVSTETFGRDNPGATIDEETVAALRGHPGVRAIDRVRRFPAWIGSRRVNVLGVDLDVPDGEARFPVMGANPDAAYARLAEGGVLVGEPLARKLGVGPGDEIPLPTRSGNALLRIAGVFRDYSSELGSVVMARARVDEVFGEAPVQAVSLFLAPGTDAEATVEDLRQRFDDRPLAFRLNRSLRAEAMRVFDQTFVITRIVQALALAIAACAVALALLVIGRESRAETALLRALGATRTQIACYYGRMGALVGVAGVSLGALGGAALAWVLVYAVNRAYFGWTIDPHPPVAALAWQIATIAAAIAAASLPPALLAGGTPARELSRERV